ncbi:hypothetical protein A8H39_10785 [Paraburkholderia fungorum]|uniref:hypothetical protein n=1 Tax=Paraburkholderia fungorum TaxID=134537 RepID=UPI0004821485|nr:hypothetical protein [Paraburkholderia fungorum]MBB5543349.1 hypothetical protein [Paraburkholderia fungorum]PNE56288.1 hypothetical protein A8H39_10785 [Paraburkholderia fungorum]
MSANVRVVVKDANGITFDPTSLPHSFTYDANNNMLTDTCFEQGAVVRQKIYTWEEGANGVWLKGTESAWINVNEGWRG